MSLQFYVDLERALQNLELKSYGGPADLKKAFYALAHRYHPDKNPGTDTSEAFRAAIASYEYCLAHLDELAARFGAPAPKAAEREKLKVENFDDIFEDIFGFSRIGRVLGYREPVAVDVTIKELLFGGVKRAKLPAYKRCPDCSGTGAAAGTLARICRHCFGKGAYERKSGGGSAWKTCPQCRGRGREIERPCARCEGFGRLRDVRRQEFSVPAGVQPGEAVSLSARDLSTGGDTEVCVVFHALRDPIFQIDKHDLMCEYRMDFLSHSGDRILNVETPFGPRQAELKKEARPGDILRIKNAGLYADVTKTRQGDLRIVLRHKRETWFAKIWGALKGKPRGGTRK